MEIALFQIDAFTGHAFGGNPAAVCPLPYFLQDDIMQAIARENNLSETAYIVPTAQGEADFDLRWFTPTVEVDLCGHATLAAAKVIFSHIRPDLEVIRFSTRSGLLTVTRDGDMLAMDFPMVTPQEVTPPESLTHAFDHPPDTVLAGLRDLLIVFPEQRVIETLAPDMAALCKAAPWGFICTAPGSDGETDFVTRCFYPNHGIHEDPVTGSAYCVAAPYWAARLGKRTMKARQLSARGGDLWLEVGPERLIIKGQALEVMRGSLMLPHIA